MLYERTDGSEYEDQNFVTFHIFFLYLNEYPIFVPRVSFGITCAAT